MIFLELTASGNGTNAGNITVFLVHVVGSRARVVAQPDTKVLDIGRFLFKDLNHQQETINFNFRFDFSTPRRTSFTDTTSPLAFLTRRIFFKKYQNRLLATKSLGANKRIRYNFGVGLAGVGRARPTTWYSCNYENTNQNHFASFVISKCLHAGQT